MAPTAMVQELGSLRGQFQCRWLKVVKSCSSGRHFLFISSDNFAVRCIVEPQCTLSQTHRETALSCQQLSYYCAIQSAKKLQFIFLVHLQENVLFALSLNVILVFIQFSVNHFSFYLVLVLSSVIHFSSYSVLVQAFIIILDPCSQW